jgi:hypothetical protein
MVPLSGLSLAGHDFTAQYYGDAVDYGSTSAPLLWFIL